MIKLAVFLALIAAVYSGTVPQDLGRTLAQQCIDEVGIEGESILALRNYVKSDSSVIPELNCFYKCFNQKMHLVDSNGAITARDYIAFLAEQVGAELPAESEIQEEVAIINTCANTDVADLCKRSVKIIQCVEREWLDKP